MKFKREYLAYLLNILKLMFNWWKFLSITDGAVSHKKRDYEIFIYCIDQNTLHHYNMQLIQYLKPADRTHCLTYILERVLEMQEVDTDFFANIIFSDEALFHLQNCLIRNFENPRMIVEQLWRGFETSDIIGPYFFENRVLKNC